MDLRLTTELFSVTIDPTPREFLQSEITAPTKIFGGRTENCKREKRS
jgi:hypothetical protein